MLVLVRSGIGIALVPASAATLHPDGVVFRSIGAFRERPVELDAVWRGDSSNPALLRYSEMFCRNGSGRQTIWSRMYRLSASLALCPGTGRNWSIKAHGRRYSRGVSGHAAEPGAGTVPAHHPMRARHCQCMRVQAQDGFDCGKLISRSCPEPVGDEAANRGQLWLDGGRVPWPRPRAGRTVGKYVAKGLRRAGANASAMSSAITSGRAATRPPTDGAAAYPAARFNCRKLWQVRPPGTTEMRPPATGEWSSAFCSAAHHDAP